MEKQKEEKYDISHYAIYDLSIISSSGYPLLQLNFNSPPPDIDIYITFFDLSNTERNTEQFNQSFELFAGLISALTEFAKLLNHQILALKFRTSKSNNIEFLENNNKFLRNPLYPIEVKINSNVIFTIQTEEFINYVALESKVFLIYDKILSNKVPIGPDSEITPEEIDYIKRIMNNSQAIMKLNSKKETLINIIKKIMEDYFDLGLRGVFITTFDYWPIFSFGIKLEDAFLLLRNIGSLPEVHPYQWKYRRGKIRDAPKWLFIINSGVGVLVEDVFNPFYYFIVCNPDTYLGETPQKIMEKINNVFE
ncbi:MAG: hypothetical protein ACTSU2_01095 [Promethearchaeota archaeon]